MFDVLVSFIVPLNFAFEDGSHTLGQVFESLTLVNSSQIQIHIDPAILADQPKGIKYQLQPVDLPGDIDLLLPMADRARPGGRDPLTLQQLDLGNLSGPLA